MSNETANQHVEYPDFNKPKTIAERLDGAQSGEEFGQTLNDLFGALERARNDE